MHKLLNIPIYYLHHYACSTAKALQNQKLTKPDMVIQLYLHTHTHTHTLRYSIPEANRHLVLNSEVDNISCWNASNKLSSKEIYMIFHTNLKEVVYPDLEINNAIIERVSRTIN